MEKDKQSILDVWGAYGQKDIDKLDRSEMNKRDWTSPGLHVNRDGGWAERTKTVYAHYTDIFYHRSIEKDKLFVLDVCGAYGQKDMEI